MWLVLRIVALVIGLRTTTQLSMANAIAHARATVAVETKTVPADVLLALAARESNYESLAHPMCGVVQVYLHGKRCDRLIAHGLAAQYAAGVDHLIAWQAACRRWHKRDLLRCALNGYAEGGLAARRGWGTRCGHGRSRCDRSASVLARARRIRGEGRRARVDS